MKLFRLRAIVTLILESLASKKSTNHWVGRQPCRRRGHRDSDTTDQDRNARNEVSVATAPRTGERRFTRELSGVLRCFGRSNTVFRIYFRNSVRATPPRNELTFQLSPPPTSGPAPDISHWESGIRDRTLGHGLAPACCNAAIPRASTSPL